MTFASAISSVRLPVQLSSNVRWWIHEKDEMEANFELGNELTNERTG